MEMVSLQKYHHFAPWGWYHSRKSLVTNLGDKGAVGFYALNKTLYNLISYQYKKFEVIYVCMNLHANGLICLLHSHTQNQLNPYHMFIHNYSIVNTVECDCDHMNQKTKSLFHQCYGFTLM
jgi:hypothetical protein